uniref:Lysine-specific demethylase-like domain-containing protein n=1 Tax=Chromera velia CCMP2878 TaxID=1169474 RepID=A0A0G4HFX2_9ALVE|eukprot:Cvel_6656.t1-p1 / transcript=Cvel_6656.t1 / gene=Cvel_6656 / organism=Chromera_velia_CCMP2878 / gene_product=hypothetical protein / transcript_product=hypothetical protein / location=Cvel_scaffold330:59895-88819(-) / protein_length=4203 / sequence_SO=supercontig / SO=protein_coding / is_pseudo=false
MSSHQRSSLGAHGPGGHARQVLSAKSKKMIRTDELRYQAFVDPDFTGPPAPDGSADAHEMKWTPHLLDKWQKKDIVQKMRDLDNLRFVTPFNRFSEERYLHRVHRRLKDKEPPNQGEGQEGETSQSSSSSSSSSSSATAQPSAGPTSFAWGRAPREPRHARVVPAPVLPADLPISEFSLQEGIFALQSQLEDLKAWREKARALLDAPADVGRDLYELEEIENEGRLLSVRCEVSELPLLSALLANAEEYRQKVRAALGLFSCDLVSGRPDPSVERLVVKEMPDQEGKKISVRNLLDLIQEGEQTGVNTPELRFLRDQADAATRWQESKEIAVDEMSLEKCKELAEESQDGFVELPGYKELARQISAASWLERAEKASGPNRILTIETLRDLLEAEGAAHVSADNHPCKRELERRKAKTDAWLKRAEDPRLALARDGTWEAKFQDLVRIGQQWEEKRFNQRLAETEAIEKAHLQHAQQQGRERAAAAAGLSALPTGAAGGHGGLGVSQASSHISVTGGGDVHAPGGGERVRNVRQKALEDKKKQREMEKKKREEGLSLNQQLHDLTGMGALADPLTHQSVVPGGGAASSSPVGSGALSGVPVAASLVGAGASAAAGGGSQPALFSHFNKGAQSAERRVAEGKSYARSEELIGLKEIAELMDDYDDLRITIPLAKTLEGFARRCKRWSNRCERAIAGKLDLKDVQTVLNEGRALSYLANTSSELSRLGQLVEKTEDWAARTQVLLRRNRKALTDSQGILLTGDAKTLENARKRGQPSVDDMRKALDLPKAKDRATAEEVEALVEEGGDLKIQDSALMDHLTNIRARSQKWKDLAGDLFKKPARSSAFYQVVIALMMDCVKLSIAPSIEKDLRCELSYKCWTEEVRRLECPADADNIEDLNLRPDAEGFAHLCDPETPVGSRMGSEKDTHRASDDSPIDVDLSAPAGGMGMGMDDGGKEDEEVEGWTETPQDRADKEREQRKRWNELLKRPEKEFIQKLAALAEDVRERAQKMAALRGEARASRAEWKELLKEILREPVSVEDAVEEVKEIIQRAVSLEREVGKTPHDSPLDVISDLLKSVDACPVRIENVRVLEERNKQLLSIEREAAHLCNHKVASIAELQAFAERLEKEAARSSAAGGKGPERDGGDLGLRKAAEVRRHIEEALDWTRRYAELWGGDASRNVPAAAAGSSEETVNSSPSADSSGSLSMITTLMLNKWEHLHAEGKNLVARVPQVDELNGRLAEAREWVTEFDKFMLGAKSARMAKRMANKKKPSRVVSLGDAERFVRKPYAMGRRLGQFEELYQQVTSVKEIRNRGMAWLRKSASERADGGFHGYGEAVVPPEERRALLSALREFSEEGGAIVQELLMAPLTVSGLKEAIESELACRNDNLLLLEALIPGEIKMDQATERLNGALALAGAEGDGEEASGGNVNLSRGGEAENEGGGGASPRPPVGEEEGEHEGEDVDMTGGAAVNALTMTTWLDEMLYGDFDSCDDPHEVEATTAATPRLADPELVSALKASLLAAHQHLDEAEASEGRCEAVTDRRLQRLHHSELLHIPEELLKRVPFAQQVTQAKRQMMMQTRTFSERERGPQPSRPLTVSLRHDAALHAAAAAAQASKEPSAAEPSVVGEASESFSPPQADNPASVPPYAFSLSAAYHAHSSLAPSTLRVWKTNNKRLLTMMWQLKGRQSGDDDEGSDDGTGTAVKAQVTELKDEDAEDPKGAARPSPSEQPPVTSASVEGAVDLELSGLLSEFSPDALGKLAEKCGPIVKTKDMQRAGRSGLTVRQALILLHRSRKECPFEMDEPRKLEKMIAHTVAYHHFLYERYPFLREAAAPSDEPANANAVPSGSPNTPVVSVSCRELAHTFYPMDEDESDGSEKGDKEGEGHEEDDGDNRAVSKKPSAPGMSSIPPSPRLRLRRGMELRDGDRNSEGVLVGASASFSSSAAAAASSFSSSCDPAAEPMDVDAGSSSADSARRPKVPSWKKSKNLLRLSAVLGGTSTSEDWENLIYVKEDQPERAGSSSGEMKKEKDDDDEALIIADFRHKAEDPAGARKEKPKVTEREKWEDNRRWSYIVDPWVADIVSNVVLRKDNEKEEGVKAEEVNKGREDVEWRRGARRLVGGHPCRGDGLRSCFLDPWKMGLKVEELTRLVEEADGLPLQTPLKGRLMCAWLIAVDWAFRAREAAHLLPSSTLPRPWTQTLSLRASEFLFVAVSRRRQELEREKLEDQQRLEEYLEELRAQEEGEGEEEEEEEEEEEDAEMGDKEEESPPRNDESSPNAAEPPGAVGVMSDSDGVTGFVKKEGEEKEQDDPMVSSSSEERAEEPISPAEDAKGKGEEPESKKRRLDDPEQPEEAEANGAHHAETTAEVGDLGTKTEGVEEPPHPTSTSPAEAKAKAEAVPKADDADADMGVSQETGAPGVVPEVNGTETEVKAEGVTAPSPDGEEKEKGDAAEGESEGEGEGASEDAQDDEAQRALRKRDLPPPEPMQTRKKKINVIASADAVAAAEAAYYAESGIKQVIAQRGIGGGGTKRKREGTDAHSVGEDGVGSSVGPSCQASPSAAGGVEDPSSKGKKPVGGSSKSKSKKPPAGSRNAKGRTGPTLSAVGTSGFESFPGSSVSVVIPASPSGRPLNEDEPFDLSDAFLQTCQPETGKGLVFQPMKDEAPVLLMPIQKAFLWARAAADHLERYSPDMCGICAKEPPFDNQAVEWVACDCCGRWFHSPCVRRKKQQPPHAPRPPGATHSPPGAAVLPQHPSRVAAAVPPKAVKQPLGGAKEPVVAVVGGAAKKKGGAPAGGKKGASSQQQIAAPTIALLGGASAVRQQPPPSRPAHPTMQVLDDDDDDGNDGSEWVCPICMLSEIYQHPGGLLQTDQLAAEVPMVMQQQQQQAIAALAAPARARGGGKAGARGGKARGGSAVAKHSGGSTSGGPSFSLFGSLGDKNGPALSSHSSSHLASEERVVARSKWMNLPAHRRFPSVDRVVRLLTESMQPSMLLFADLPERAILQQRLALLMIWIWDWSRAVGGAVGNPPDELIGLAPDLKFFSALMTGRGESQGGGEGNGGQFSWPCSLDFPSPCAPVGFVTPSATERRMMAAAGKSIEELLDSGFWKSEGESEEQTLSSRQGGGRDFRRAPSVDGRSEVMSVSVVIRLDSQGVDVGGPTSRAPVSSSSPPTASPPTAAESSTEMAERSGGESSAPFVSSPAALSEFSFPESFPSGWSLLPQSLLVVAGEDSSKEFREDRRLLRVVLPNSLGVVYFKPPPRKGNRGGWKPLSCAPSLGNPPSAPPLSFRGWAARAAAGIMAGISSTSGLASELSLMERLAGWRQEAAGWLRQQAESDQSGEADEGGGINELHRLAASVPPHCPSDPPELIQLRLREDRVKEFHTELETVMTALDQIAGSEIDGTGAQVTYESPMIPQPQQPGAVPVAAPPPKLDILYFELPAIQEAARKIDCLSLREVSFVGKGRVTLFRLARKLIGLWHTSKKMDFVETRWIEWDRLCTEADSDSSSSRTAEEQKNNAAAAAKLTYADPIDEEAHKPTPSQGLLAKPQSDRWAARAALPPRYSIEEALAFRTEFEEFKEEVDKAGVLQRQNEGHKGNQGGHEGAEKEGLPAQHAPEEIGVEKAAEAKKEGGDSNPPKFSYNLCMLYNATGDLLKRFEEYVAKAKDLDERVAAAIAVQNSKPVAQTLDSLLQRGVEGTCEDAVKDLDPLLAVCKVADRVIAVEPQRAQKLLEILRQSKLAIAIIASVHREFIRRCRQQQQPPPEGSDKTVTVYASVERLQKVVEQFHLLRQSEVELRCRLPCMTKYFWRFSKPGPLEQEELDKLFGGSVQNAPLHEMEFSNPFLVYPDKLATADLEEVKVWSARCRTVVNKDEPTLVEMHRTLQDARNIPVNFGKHRLHQCLADKKQKQAQEAGRKRGQGGGVGMPPTVGGGQTSLSPQIQRGPPGRPAPMGAVTGGIDIRLDMLPPEFRTMPPSGHTRMPHPHPGMHGHSSFTFAAGTLPPNASPGGMPPSVQGRAPPGIPNVSPNPTRTATGGGPVIRPALPVLSPTTGGNPMSGLAASAGMAVGGFGGFMVQGPNGVPTLPSTGGAGGAQFLPGPAEPPQQQQQAQGETAGARQAETDETMGVSLPTADSESSKGPLSPPVAGAGGGVSADGSNGPPAGEQEISLSGLPVDTTNGTGPHHHGGGVGGSGGTGTNGG